MIRGIFFFLVVWLVVALSLFILSKLRKSERLTVLRCLLYGLGTASLAMGVLLLVVYLF